MTRSTNLAEKTEQPNIEGRMAMFHGGGSDVFANALKFKEAEMLRQLKMYPYYQVIERNEASTCLIEDKEVIMLGSNNYLGLTIHPEVREAAAQAIYKYGTSLTGSRLLNGTHKLHRLLEEELADFFGKQDCLVFSTGYQANLGVLSALITKGTTLVMDKADHASIYDGASLAKGDVATFSHRDHADLERVLSEIDPEVGKMIMVDGVFSMEGDICDLPEIAKLAKKYNARLCVDDAHAVGVVGVGGRGTASHFGLEDDVDLIVGTFSKSLASVGGFVVGDANVVDFIGHFGRSVIFSASLPPASVEAARAALRILRREPERVDRVNENACYMRDNLKELGFDIGISETPVVPIVIGDEILTLTLWRELLEEGVYVNSVVYPAVKKDSALLRTSYTSEHTREHLDKALDVFVKLKKKHGF